MIWSCFNEGQKWLGEKIHILWSGMYMT